LRNKNIRRESIERAGIALVIVVATVLHRQPALAFSTGITGVSGKQGSTCRSCHSGGVAPTVHFEGPDQLAAGATAPFRFVVQSQAPSTQVAAGLDVAVSAGKLAAVSGQGERLLSGEITHTGPKDNDANGVASFDFTWQAPAQPGTATLFGAGNSVNLSGTSFGDAPGTTTFQVLVTDVATPTPTDTPPEVPTPTATPSPPVSTCIGDCDGSGDVTIDELIVGVNITLGIDDVTMCPSLDVNHDGVVTVMQLLLAVNAALNGCTPAGGQ
jgi:hypothetical protein